MLGMKGIKNNKEKFSIEKSSKLCDINKSRIIIYLGGVGNVKKQNKRFSSITTDYDNNINSWDKQSS